MRGFLQQLLILLVDDDCLAKVDRPVNDRLFLLAVQDSWNDALGRDAESAVIEDDGAESVEPFHVNAGVRLHALKVVGGSAVGGSIATKFFVVVLWEQKGM